jgi:hypothetical protein
MPWYSKIPLDPGTPSDPLKSLPSSGGEWVQDPGFNANGIVFPKWENPVGRQQRSSLFSGSTRRREMRNWLV